MCFASHQPRPSAAGGEWRLGKGKRSETSENGTFRSWAGLSRSLARSLGGVWHMALIAKTATPRRRRPSVELRRCRLSLSPQLSSTPSVQIVFRPRFSLDASLAGLPEREEKSSGSKRPHMKCCRTKEHNGKMSQANMELHSADIENELESVIRSALIVFLLLCIYRTCRPHVYHFQGVFTPGLVSPHNIVYRLTSFP